MKDDYIYCPRCKNNLVEEEKDNETVKVCKSCGFIFWNNPKPVASILIHDDNKVLMIQRANEPFENFWVLPGGFVKHDETSQEAVKRELKEETNLDAEIEGIIGVYKIDNDPRGMHLDIVFHGTSIGSIKLSEEDKEWKYFLKKELPEKIAYKHREAIKDWYNQIDD